MAVAFTKADWREMLINFKAYAKYEVFGGDDTHVDFLALPQVHELDAENPAKWHRSHVQALWDYFLPDDPLPNYWLQSTRDTIDVTNEDYGLKLIEYRDTLATPLIQLSYGESGPWPGDSTVQVALRIEGQFIAGEVTIPDAPDEPLVSGDSIAGAALALYGVDTLYPSSTSFGGPTWWPNEAGDPSLWPFTEYDGVTPVGEYEPTAPLPFAAHRAPYTSAVLRAEINYVNSVGVPSVASFEGNCTFEVDNSLFPYYNGFQNVSFTADGVSVGFVSNPAGYLVTFNQPTALSITSVNFTLDAT